MKLRVFNFVIAVILMCGSWNAIAAPHANLVDRTSDLIGYLNHLWGSGLLSEAALRTFVGTAAVDGKLVCPILEIAPEAGEPFGTIKANYARNILAVYIDKLNRHEIVINLKEVLAWGDKMVEEGRQAKVQRQEVGSQTYIVDRKMIFNRVEGGAFHLKIIRWKNTMAFPVNIPEAFEMLSTRVKEWHWAMIMGSNPFKSAENSIKKELFPGSIIYQVDQDVGGTQVEMFRKFLKRLNQLSEIGSPVLYELIEGHQPGDRFRLPSETEWSFVLQKRDSKYEPECGSTGERYSPWVVDGKTFEGFDSDEFEWVDDGWGENFDDWPQSLVYWDAPVVAKKKMLWRTSQAVPLETPIASRAPKHSIRYVRRRAWSKETYEAMPYGKCRAEEGMY